LLEIEEEIGEIDKEKLVEEFISRNPNPVLKVGKEGTVLYVNKAAGSLLEYWGIKKGEKVPQSLRHSIKRALSKENPKNLEIKTGKKTYSIVLYPLPEEGCVNLQGFDISSRVRAEEKLRVHQQELERLFEKRTLEYTEANEKLAQEVTERRKVENKLQNNVQFLETLLDSIPSPVFQRDLNGRYVNCNESFARQIMGLPKDIVIGGSFQEFQKRVPKELAEIYIKHDRKLIEKGGSQYYDTKVVCADGVQRDFLFHKATYEDGSGEVAGVVGVMLDITQLKAAEKASGKNEERYRIAAEQTGQLVYDYDIESGKIDWAGAISQITGYSPEEFKKVDLKGWIAHIHEVDKRKAWEAHERCMKTGGKYLEEYRFGKKDGSYFHAEDSSAYLLDENGGIYRIVRVIKDITERKFASEILERSEERYRAVAVQTGQLIYDYDVKNDHSSWAGAIEELTGYSSEEFQSFTPDVWADHVHPEDREKAIKAHESCRNGEKYFEEYRLRRKDGSYFYVEDSGVYLKNENRGIYRVLGVMKDITERKLAQEKLEKSEEKYRIAAEQTGQIVFDYDPDTGEADWAGAINEITGYSCDEFQKFNQKIWVENLHPEDRERVTGSIKRSFENGEKFNEEFRFRRKDGNYIHVEYCGVWIKDEAGCVYRALGVMKDITGIKLASEKLKESEQRYRSFMKNFGGIAFQVGLDFTPILVDGNVEEITGYKANDIISGKVDWYQIVFPQDRKRLFENREKLMNDPLLFIEHEYRIKHRDGKVKWIREIIQNVSDATGKKRILQGAIYDVTRQKEAEDSLVKVEEIRKKEIHHRIKNNLQVISSLLELQAEKFNDQEVLEAFHESQNRVAAMAIIHEELYRSKNNETLDFSAYLQKLTADLLRSYTVRAGDVRMQLDIEETFLGMDTAVPLGIIINELVSNSLKHAFPPGRKGEIRIKLCKTEESKKNKNISNIINNIDSKNSVDKSIQYKLIISDNGLGFPENIDFRNTSSLGLQLVNILVEQLEGTIELEKGVETAFKILFKEDN